jgi:predicted PurR-regulated permease PerM
MDKKINVSITPGTIVMTILIAAGAYVFWILRGLILLMLTAVVIASAIEPGVIFFRKRKIHRIVAVSVMYVLVFGSFFGIIYFFFPPLLGDMQNLIATVPQYLNTLNLPSFLGNSSIINNSAGTTHQAQSIFNTLYEFRSAFSADTSQGAFRLISTFFGGIFSLSIVVVLSFYFAIQETGVEDFLKIVTPTKYEEYVIGLWYRAQKKIGQWMQGQLLLSLLVAVTIYLGLLLLRIPDALFISVFTAIAEVIPIFGPFIAAFPAVLIAYSAGGGIVPALYVTGLFVVVNQFEGSLIHPLIVKKVVGIPPLMVLLAIIAGGDLAGFLGVVLSVPLAAVLREALSDFEKRKHKLEKVDSKEMANFAATESGRAPVKKVST